MNSNSIKTHRDKREAILQWTKDPCGTGSFADLQVGSSEFYHAVDLNRYVEYGPWMKTALCLKEHRGRKVLEVGFGMGTDLFQMASAGAEVFGIDLSPTHLEIASKRFSSSGLSANLQIADAERIPFPDATFDVVYSFGVIHHTPDTEQAIREIYRVLKPGGKLILGVYHFYSAYFFCCVLAPYFLKLKFLHESWRRALSRIEYRENSDACPLVKLYSRRSLMGLCSQFKEIQLEGRHLNAEHFGPLRFLSSANFFCLNENDIGWYLIAKCTK